MGDTSNHSGDYKTMQKKKKYNKKIKLTHFIETKNIYLSDDNNNPKISFKKNNKKNILLYVSYSPKKMKQIIQLILLYIESILDDSFGHKVEMRTKIVSLLCLLSLATLLASGTESASPISLKPSHKASSFNRSLFPSTFLFGR